MRVSSPKSAIQRNGPGHRPLIDSGRARLESKARRRKRQDIPSQRVRRTPRRPRGKELRPQLHEWSQELEIEASRVPRVMGEHSLLLPLSGVVARRRDDCSRNGCPSCRHACSIGRFDQDQEFIPSSNACSAGRQEAAKSSRTADSVRVTRSSRPRAVRPTVSSAHSSASARDSRRGRL
jgi:hypothetical protein